MAAYHYQQGDRPLDGYTIQHALGRGGFGEVYFAVSDAGREVALKSVLNFEDIELRGIGHCMNLKSPHLVMIFDVKQGEDGTPWVIMEYVSGRSLRQVLDEAPDGLDPEQATFFLRELAKGIDYLHDAGIVHRDLKPHNVFFEDGRVKIGDYSLSKVMTVSHASGHTMTVGSVHYMAPEISMGKYDKTVDLYALGVMLFEMLTGKPPFVGESVGEVLMKHLNGQLDVSKLPQPFADVVQKSMDRDPAKRFQSAREMANALALADYPQALEDSVPASLSLVGKGAVVTDHKSNTEQDERPEIGRIDESDLADTVGPASAISDTAESPRRSPAHSAIELFGGIDRRTANNSYLTGVALSLFSTMLLIWLSMCFSNEIWDRPMINGPMITDVVTMGLGVWSFAVIASVILVIAVPQEISFRNGIICRAALLVLLGVTRFFTDSVVDEYSIKTAVVGGLVGTTVAMMIMDWLHFTNPHRSERVLIFRTLIAGGLSGIASTAYYPSINHVTIAMASTMAVAITVQLASPWVGPRMTSDQNTDQSSQPGVDSQTLNTNHSSPSLSVSTPTPEPIT